jgi:hypothetical protein
MLPVVLGRDALAVARRFSGGALAVHAGVAGGTVRCSVVDAAVPRRTRKRVVAITADGVGQQQRKESEQDAADAAKLDTGNG